LNSVRVYHSRVEERIPLKQGLKQKPHATAPRRNDVEERIPLKQEKRKMGSGLV